MGVIEQDDAHHHAGYQEAVVCLEVGETRVVVSYLGQGNDDEVEGVEDVVFNAMVDIAVRQIVFLQL